MPRYCCARIDCSRRYGLDRPGSYQCNVGLRAQYPYWRLGRLNQRFPKKTVAYSPPLRRRRKAAALLSFRSRSLLNGLHWIWIIAAAFCRRAKKSRQSSWCSLNRHDPQCHQGSLGQKPLTLTVRSERPIPHDGDPKAVCPAEILQHKKIPCATEVAPNEIVPSLRQPPGTDPSSTKNAFKLPAEENR